MSFLHRLGRLVRADAHGLLESLEDRALLVKQHLREAELELQRKRARLGALAEEERRLGDDASRLEATVHALDQDVQLALARGREDLARFAIRRLLPRRGEAASLRRRAGEIAEERGRLEQRAARQETELEELRARARARLAEEVAAPEAGPDAAAVADEEVEMELLRRARAEGVR
jgi:phage shock protein A